MWRSKDEERNLDLIAWLGYNKALAQPLLRTIVSRFWTLL
jgi:hypothetical protein